MDKRRAIVDGFHKLIKYDTDTQARQDDAQKVALLTPLNKVFQFYLFDFIANTGTARAGQEDAPVHFISSPDARLT